LPRDDPGRLFSIRKMNLRRSIALDNLVDTFERIASTPARTDPIEKRGTEMTISRRSFVCGIASLGAIHLAPRASVAQTSSEEYVTLENDNLLLRFDRGSGALCELQNKVTKWKIQGGLNSEAFRLHVPLPDRSNHFVSGGGNKLDHVTVSPDGTTAEFVWKGLNSPHAGILDIGLTCRVRLTKSGFETESEIDNLSPYPVDSLSFPILSDMSLPPGSATLQQQQPRDYSGGLTVSPLLPDFKNDIGYWGEDFPATIANNWVPWNFILAAGESEGLYVATHQVKLKDKAMFQFELHPAYTDSFLTTSLNPAAGQEMERVSLQVIQFFFLAPKSRKNGQAIVLAPYSGDWHAGVDIYKKWRATWFLPPVSPAWADDVVSWQQVQINSSEDRLLFPYRDLVEYGKDCAAAGVKAIQLTGWNIGGQDRSYPNHDTDPRLGTKDDLAEAIKQCRDLGVEIVLFNKYVYTDISTDWWTKELHRYAAMDPFGMPYGLGGGDLYDTPVQLASINARRLAVMCTACKEWQDICVHEFKKSVELGAGGILFDEVIHHGGLYSYCFSPDHGHPVPAYIYSADVDLVNRFRSLVDPANFVFAGEAPYDQELTGYRVYYTRISAGHIPVLRYIDSHQPIMIAATGTNDRTMLNRALLHRYNISYEPRNFKGRLSEIPATIEYGKAIDNLRRRYRSLLWDAEYLDTVGARVSHLGKPHSPYSVFVERSSGRRAVVVANEGLTETVSLTVDLPDRNKISVVRPESPETADADATLNLGPASAAVLMEIR